VLQAVGVETLVGNHTFSATGITAYLKNRVCSKMPLPCRRAARELLESSDTSSLVGLRDRALIGFRHSSSGGIISHRIWRFADLATRAMKTVLPVVLARTALTC
jgi:hypothetical protein